MKLSFLFSLGPRLSRGLLACMLLAAAVAPCRAQSPQYPLAQPNGFTWGELARLPPYCVDTQGTVWALYGGTGPESPNLPKWMALVGKDFYHFHHYCYGMRDVFTAQSLGIGTPKGQERLRLALGQFGYMIRNCSPTMRLMPEIYYKVGEVHLMLNEAPEAKRAFEKARELKPDYWPAYTRWADKLIELKLYDSARNWLEEGLTHSPTEPELLKRLQLVGERSSGKKSTKATKTSKPSKALDAPAAPETPEAKAASAPTTSP